MSSSSLHLECEHETPDSQLYPVWSVAREQSNNSSNHNKMYTVRAAPSPLILCMWLPCRRFHCMDFQRWNKFWDTQKVKQWQTTEEEEKKSHSLPQLLLLALSYVWMCESLMACAHSNVKRKYNDTMPSFHTIVQLMIPMERNVMLKLFREKKCMTRSFVDNSLLFDRSNAAFFRF